MSKGALLTKIRYELDKINEQIDIAIVEGRAYKHLALRHKVLLSRFNRLKTEAHPWLSRSFRFLTLF